MYCLFMVIFFANLFSLWESLTNKNAQCTSGCWLSLGCNARISGEEGEGRALRTEDRSSQAEHVTTGKKAKNV